MIERITEIIDPGRALYAIATESPEGRRIALSIEVRVYSQKNRVQAEGVDISLHTQPLAGQPGGNHSCLALKHDLRCHVTWTSALQADDFYKKHGNQDNAFEQPESFWIALEARLRRFIENKEHFPASDDLGTDTLASIVAAVEKNTYPELRIVGGEDGFSVLKANPIEAHVVGVGYTITNALRDAYITLVVDGECVATPR